MSKKVEQYFKIKEDYYIFVNSLFIGEVKYEK